MRSAAPAGGLGRRSFIQQQQTTARCHRAGPGRGCAIGVGRVGVDEFGAFEELCSEPVCAKAAGV